MTLIINSTTESREVVVFRTTFDMLRKEILLQMENITEIKRGANWVPYKIENVEQGKLVRLNNNLFVDNLGVITTPPIDTVTGSQDLTGLTGSYDYLISMTGTDVGMTATSDIVFEFISAKLEAFVVANNLQN